MCICTLHGCEVLQRATEKGRPVGDVFDAFRHGASSTATKKSAPRTYPDSLPLLTVAAEASNHKAVEKCARSPDHFAPCTPFERPTISVGCTTLPEWPDENGAAMARGRSLMHTLAMDSTRFTSGDLCGLLLELFQEAELPEEVPIGCVKRMILAVREHMYENPYHNFSHVFDVAQTTFVLAETTGLMERLDTWERFALLAAAVCHDLEHPGVDKGFVESAALGDAFLDKLLEKHHTLRAFEIMADSEIGVLQGISTVRYHAFRQAVSGCILATCPADHSEFVAKLEGLKGGEGGVAAKQLEMELLIKAADISNVLKPFPVAARWALRVTDEFFLQGDVERQHGMLPVTPLCDRAQQSRVACQKGFIDYVCAPFFDAMATLYPALRPAVRVMHANRAQWDTYSDARLELLHRDHPPLLPSSPTPDALSSDDAPPCSLSLSLSLALSLSLSPSPSPLPRPSSLPLDVRCTTLPPGLSQTLSRRNLLKRSE